MIAGEIIQHLDSERDKQLSFKF